MNLNPEIVSDVQRIAEHLGTSILSRSEYVPHGQFSLYQIYDGGATLEDYCRAAGVDTKKKEEVPDEVYFGRLVRAIKELGRQPKTSERKKFGLNFSKRRFPTLSAFIQAGIERGIIEGSRANTEISQPERQPRPSHLAAAAEPRVPSDRQIPPIPPTLPESNGRGSMYRVSPMPRKMSLAPLHFSPSYAHKEQSTGTFSTSTRARGSTASAGITS